MVLILFLSTSSKATNVLLLLGKVASYALKLTGFFYCQVTPALRSERYLIILSFLYVYSFLDSITFLATYMMELYVKLNLNTSNISSSYQWNPARGWFWIKTAADCQQLNSYWSILMVYGGVEDVGQPIT